MKDGNILCPIVVDKRFKNNWDICNEATEYLVQGTLLCRDHAIGSEIQRSYPAVCGNPDVGRSVGADGEESSHVIRPGIPWCLCTSHREAEDTGYLHSTTGDCKCGVPMHDHGASKEGEERFEAWYGIDKG